MYDNGVHLRLTLREDGPLGVGPAEGVKDGHECLVLRLLIKLQVHHRLRELHAVTNNVSNRLAFD